MSSRHSVSLVRFMATSRKVIVSVLLSQSILLSQPVFPQRVLAQSAPSTPINLDLSSKNKTVSAGNLGGGTAAIKVGGQMMNVTGSTLLTPAENLAVQQILGGGQQSIVLSTLGNATGGTFNIGGTFNSYASSITIPTGVTAIQNAAHNANLVLTGNLINSGSLYGVSTNPSITSMVINAQNIFNMQGGLISTVLPSGGLPGITGANSNLNLSLNAVTNLVNAGSIVCSGNLSLSAGGAIMNTLPAGATGARPVIQAAGDLNLMASQVVNAGTLSSLAGNINFATQNPQSMTITNTGGTIQALMGSINLRDSLFTGKFDTALLNGDLFSKELNVFSGDGFANINVGKLTGIANITAGKAQLSAGTENLLVGNMTLSGDPLISNFQGDVTLTTGMTLVTDGFDLAIVAKGNVLNQDATVIDTSSAVRQGGNLTIVAGAKFDQPVGQVIEITGASTTGGKIDLVSTKAITKISSSSTNNGVNNDAGNIQMIAFAGSGAGSGTITLPSTAPITADSDNGKAGDITIIAGGKQNIVVDTTSGAAVPVSISGETTGGTSKTINGIGNIHNIGKTAGTGDVSIFGATPTVSVGGVTINDGTIASGSFGHLTPAAKNGRIFLNKINSGGDLTISTGDSIVLKAPIVVAGDASVSTTANSGNIVITNNFVAGGNITMSANGFGTISTPNQDIANPAVGKYVFGVALTPDGNFGYAPNNTDNTVSVIQTSTNTVISTISLSTLISSTSGPKGAAASPDGKYVYVVGASKVTPGNGVVVVIDTATQTISTNYEFVAGDSANKSKFDPQLVAVAPNGNILIFNDYQLTGTSTLPNEVTLLSPAGVPLTNSPITLTGGIGRPTNLGAIAVNPQGTLLYVGNMKSNNVSVVDLTNNTFTGNIALPAGTNFGPVALAFNPTGTRLYVGHSDGNFNNSIGKILAIDTIPTSATFNTVLNIAASQTIGGGYLPQGIQTSPTGTQLFINPTYYELSVVYNPLTLQIVETTGIGASLAPDGYGSNTFSSIVTNSGVRNVQTYIACPTHSGAAGTVAVIQTPTIQGANISLSSQNGQISVNYDTQGGTFSANTGSSIIAGNVGLAPSFLGASSSGTATGTVFHIGSMNGITTTGAINAGGLLYLSANNGGITLGGNVGSSKLSSVTLEAGGTGSIIQNAGTIAAKSVMLNATGGGDIKGSSSHLSTATPLLNAYALGGDIKIQNTGALTVQSLGAGKSLDLKNSANIAFLTAISAVQGVNVATTAANGKIALAGINAFSSNIAVKANGSGAITSTSALIGDSIYLESGTGSIGASASELQTKAATKLEVHTAGAGSAFIHNTSANSLQLADSGAGATFSLRVNGDISADAISAKTITLSTDAGSDGDITLNKSMGSPTAIISLTTDDTGNISVANTLTAGTLTAKSGTGNINLNIIAPKLTAQTSGTGDVTIFNGVQTATILGLSGDSISAIGSQKLVISGNITGGSGVNLSVTGPDDKSSITQTASKFTISGTSLSLNGGKGSIGTKAMPIQSKVQNLNANAAGAVFLKDSGGDTTIDAASSGSSFNLTSEGSILQSVGIGTTSIFSPIVNLTSGKDIGSFSQPLAISGTDQATPSTVALNFKATGDAYVNGVNTTGLGTVNLNFIGKSSAGGTAGAFVTANGNVNFATGASLTASNVAPSAAVDIGVGGNITQTAASGTTIFANNLKLLSLANNIGGATPLFISALGGSNSTINLEADGTQVNIGGNSFVRLGDLSASTGTTSFKLSSTGDITVGSGATVSAPTVQISAKGSITQADSSSTLTLNADNLSLAAGTTGIGTAANNIGFDSSTGTTANLTTTTAGNVFLNAPGTKATSGVVLTGVSTGKGIGGFNLISDNGIGFANGATLTAAKTDLKTSAMGAGITQAGTGLSIISPNVKLDSAAAIGSSGQNLNLSSSKILLNATSSDEVWINGKGIVNLTGASQGNGVAGFHLTSSGNMAIFAGATVFSLTTVSLTSTTGNITQVDPSGTLPLSAFAINLNAGGSGGVGTATNRIGMTSASPIALNAQAAKGNVFLEQSGGAGTTISGANTAKVFDFKGDGSVTIETGATVTGNTSVAISSSSGFIRQNGAVTTLISPKLTLTGAALGIGTGGQSILFANLAGKTTAVTLAANSLGTTNLSGTAPVTLLASSGATDFNLTSTGNIAVTAPVTSPIVNLTTPGNITTSGTGTVDGTITNLNAKGGGSIGGSAPLVTGATTLSADTDGFGIVNIKSTKNTGITLNTSSSGGSFTLSGKAVHTAGPVTTNAAQSSKLGNLTLIAEDGLLQISGNLHASGGSMKLQSTSKSTGSIIIDGGLTLDTIVTALPKGTNGQVSIIIGTATSTSNPYPGTTVNNLQVTQTGPGKVFYGATPGAISVTGPGTAQLFATNQNIFLNSPDINRTIEIGTGTTITADPPAPLPITVSPSSHQLQIQSAAQQLPAVSNTNTTAALTVFTTPSVPNTSSITGTDTLLRGSVKATAATAGAPAARRLRKAITGSGDSTGGTTITSYLPTESFPAAANKSGVIYAPKKDMQIKTPSATINIGANSVALVFASENGISVYNLHDDNAGDISISTAESKHQINIGEHAMLSTNSGNYADINPAPSITHADLSETNLSGGARLFRSNFSLMSAITEYGPLAALKHSTTPSERKIAARVLKNAAIMMQVRKPTTPYSRMSTTRQAMLKDSQPPQPVLAQQ